MIDPNYKYRTKYGDHDVVFYNVAASGVYPVHGYIKIRDNQILMQWDERGRSDPAYSLSEGRDWDLIKIRYSPKKEKAIVVVSKYPMPLPTRILEKFNGKRTRVTLEEI